jgi:hypothetical protein
MHRKMRQEDREFEAKLGYLEGSLRQKEGATPLANHNRVPRQGDEIPCHLNGAPVTIGDCGVGSQTHPKQFSQGQRAGEPPLGD